MWQATVPLKAGFSEVIAFWTVGKFFRVLPQIPPPPPPHMLWVILNKVNSCISRNLRIVIMSSQRLLLSRLNSLASGEGFHSFEASFPFLNAYF